MCFFYKPQIDAQDIDGAENGNVVCTPATNKAAVCISGIVVMYAEFKC